MVKKNKTILKWILRLGTKKRGGWVNNSQTSNNSFFRKKKKILGKRDANKRLQELHLLLVGRIRKKKKIIQDV